MGFKTHISVNSLLAPKSFCVFMWVLANKAVMKLINHTEPLYLYHCWCFVEVKVIGIH